MAVLMTFEENRGPVAGKTFAWIGDGDNVCASFIHAAARFDFHLVVAGPRRYWPSDVDLAKAPGLIEVSEDMMGAARGADCVIADGWVSMGHEDYQARVEAFAPYVVDEALMATAAPDAVFLHCLPAHRGEEVTAGVIDGRQSLVWDEAENRIHVQKSILAWCFGALG
jgi:ornithine carbamoyltransferase